MRLALIPARGGSKRVPLKNIAPFGGRPMIEWTIEAAMESKVFDDVAVSTDHDAIAEVAERAGAAIYRRPQSVSDDAATLLDVAKFTISDVALPAITEICLLLANCPLRTADQIAASAKLWSASRPPALISVVEYGWTPPFRAQSVGDGGRLSSAFPELNELKSQFYPKVVCPTGAIYWSTSQELLRASTLYIDGIIGFPMPWHLGIDIDTREDLRLAECLRFSMAAGFRFGDEEWRA